MNLHHLLRPKSVAIVGASEKLGFGRDASQNMLACDLGDNLYFVNPNREQVLGKKCHKSISDIGHDIDMAIICTPLFTVNNIQKKPQHTTARVRWYMPVAIVKLVPRGN